MRRGNSPTREKNFVVGNPGRRSNFPVRLQREGKVFLLLYKGQKEVKKGHDKRVKTFLTVLWRLQCNTTSPQPRSGNAKRIGSEKARARTGEADLDLFEEGLRQTKKSRSGSSFILVRWELPTSDGLNNLPKTACSRRTAWEEQKRATGDRRERDLGGFR